MAAVIFSLITLPMEETASVYNTQGWEGLPALKGVSSKGWGPFRKDVCQVVMCLQETQGMLFLSA